jgi:hypothetical protein
MQEDQYHEEVSKTGEPRREESTIPPCCGSGCAVCVLDYWTEDEYAPVAPAQSSERKAEMSTESFTEGMSESEMLAMLEAIEKAQWQAQLVITQLDGE